MALWRRSDLHSECSGETSVSVRLRQEPSVSTDAVDVGGGSADSYVLFKGGGRGENKQHRFSGAWCDDVRSTDRSSAGDTVYGDDPRDNSHSLSIPTPDLKIEQRRRRTSIDDVLRRLRLIRKQMEEGIEAMQCQMYQIQFCNNHVLKQHQQEQRDTELQCLPRKRLDECMPNEMRHAPQPSSSHPDRTASTQDAFCATSRSEMTDHSTDYCAEVQKPYTPDTDSSSVFPIHTPLILESMEMVLARQEADSTSGMLGNNPPGGSSLPIPPQESAFQACPSELSLTNESVEDVCRMMEEALFMESSRGQCLPTIPLYPPREFKTDVVLNLQAQFHSETSDQSTRIVPAATAEQPTATHCHKKSAMDKFFGLFCTRRFSKRQSKMDEGSDQTQTAVKKRNRYRWSPRFRLDTPRRLHYRPTSPSSSSGCKFTEKYPVECDSESDETLQQCFSPDHHSDHVLFEDDGTVVSSTGIENNYVISAEGIASGITCFDVTCHSLDGWCFVGVIDKDDVINDHGHLSRCKTAHGWSNQAECFKGGVPHFIADKKLFENGAEFQVCINAEAGTVHFRFPKSQSCSAQDAESSEFTGFEISALPKNVEWNLVLEWSGSARFELNSVSAWQ